MATYIYNETLWGVIDGVNTTYTTLNNIFNIEEVYLGGVAYRDISFVVGTNVIEFVDAPPLGSAAPTADYFIQATVVTAASTDVTFGDVIDDTFEKIGASRTSAVYLENQIQRQINKGYKRIKNIKSYKDKVLQYTFNKANDMQAVWYDASTITTAAESYVPAAWAVLLWDTSFVNYTSYSSGVFSAVAGYTYNSGDKVSVGYKLPSIVKRPAEVIMDKQVLTYVDNREYVNRAGSHFYTCIQDSNGDTFIFLPYMAQDAIITVKHVPNDAILTLDADIVNIIYEYSDVLSLYAAYNVLMLREDDRWQAVKQEYIELLRDYKAYKSKAVDGINNRFRTTSLVRGQGNLRRSTFI